jgi:hypothetical protein
MYDWRNVLSMACIHIQQNVLAHYFDVRHADQALSKYASISHDHKILQSKNTFIPRQT